MLAIAGLPTTSPTPGHRGGGLLELIAYGSQMSSTSGQTDSATSTTTSLTLHASATARTVPDTDLTNLGWLQKPGVLTSMCTALTAGSDQEQGKPVRHATRKARQVKSSDGRAEGVVMKSSSRSSDKMVNVILNVRNRKYNGEDARKPPLSFACMIFMAVESSPTKTLPVKDIYDWVMWKFPYYRNAPPGWKNSVRHNLSLNKCFKKVDRSWGKPGAVSKGGLWTVDPDYRRSLLAALKRSPYHPYHSYFTGSLSASSSNSSLDSVDPAERDAALTMCMISGGSESGSVSDQLHAVIHDHCYTKCPLLPPSPPPSPSPQVTVKLRTSSRRTRSAGLTLDEIAAAAELILAQDSEDKETGSESESSDEGLGGEVESDMEDEHTEVGSLKPSEVFLGDSGYGAPVAMETNSALDEMGADALLCLATGTKEMGADALCLATGTKEMGADALCLATGTKEMGADALLCLATGTKAIST